MSLRQEYAYVSNQGPNSRARTHLVTDSPIVSGRLRRAAGDALCKPRSKFYHLSHECQEQPKERLCPRCVEIAERLGLRGWALPPEVQRELDANYARAREVAPTILHRISTPMWESIFEEAQRDAPVGLFDMGSLTAGGPISWFYNGPARVLVEQLDSIWDDISPFAREELCSSLYPFGTTRQALLRRQLIVDKKPPYGEDWKLPLGHAVIKRAKETKRA